LVTVGRIFCYATNSQPREVVDFEPSFVEAAGVERACRYNKPPFASDTQRTILVVHESAA